MQLSCVHCGKPFQISSDQLGRRGRCPHCQGTILLPEALGPSAAEPATPREPIRWRENSISFLTSLVFHMLLFLIFAPISWEEIGSGGGGQDVWIGDLASRKLAKPQADEFAAVAEPAPKTDPAEEEMLEVVPPLEPSDDSEPEARVAVVAPSLSGSNSGTEGSFDLGTVSAGGGDAGNWNGFVQNLRQSGLDIVICFDSTGSMGGEIREVKEQIRRIGEALFKLIPKTRISICTYRDAGDEYVAKGLPLTDDLQEVERYLAGIEADAGGDRPEAVHAGLRWSVENNRFRPAARKVILLFGDAPPHRQNLQECLTIASDFARQQKGIVSTVTCRLGVRLSEFEQIAQMGGGEAFLTSDERQIMTQLMVLVFGSRYREKVIDALRLLGR